MKLSRRNALMAGAAAPLLTGLSGRTVRAEAEMKGAQPPSFNRFTLGTMEVTALLAGNRTVEDPQGTFGMNVSEEEFAEVSEANFIPADKTQFFFTPTLVNTGSELILFDTGLSPESITGPLEAAGYSADQVDTVVLTHMHGDHIGGIASDAGPTFANAAYVTAAREFDHWKTAGNEGFDAKVAPLADRFTFLEDGGSVTSGITAMLAPGHTPGHTTYMIESDGEQLLLAADLANHYVWSLAYPDWEVRFDMDKAQAAESRRKVLGMLAADRVPFIGYHMPFPALGFVAERDDGFRYVPSSYQMML
ncbi:MBL fold metallo-hydrolase [Algicella marina]|uniref:MBL fold metallo-hydrolase n=1 Tax=Algicella marina TaxID=2683284 RepID=A0A6P1T0F4_9RHOB|nr:MBL fold metallo-hydrolase [Algicella marina]QHQ35487.1 MBL fold metallo-hydrolase [Algicella marina]